MGPYTLHVSASASRNAVPSQLIAAIILNELSDISIADILQEKTGSTSGSIGIAQMTVEVARVHNLVDVTGDIATQLRRPRLAIEAVARYLKVLLQDMVANADHPWQKKADFRLTDIVQLKRPDNLYQFIGAGDQVTREQLTAALMAAAYNSPDIIRATDPQSVDPENPTIYKNAVAHAANAALVAERLAVPPPLFRFRG